MYRFNSRIIDTSEFPDIFEDEIVDNDGYRLMYVHLSTDPKTLLQQAISTRTRRLRGTRSFHRCANRGPFR